MDGNEENEVKMKRTVGASEVDKEDEKR